MCEEVKAGESETQIAGEREQEVNSGDHVTHIDKKNKRAKKKNGDQDTDEHVCSDHWIELCLIGLARSLNSFPAARSIGRTRTAKGGIPIYPHVKVESLSFVKRNKPSLLKAEVEYCILLKFIHKPVVPSRTEHGE